MSGVANNNLHKDQLVHARYEKTVMFRQGQRSVTKT